MTAKARGWSTETTGSSRSSADSQGHSWSTATPALEPWHPSSPAACPCCRTRSTAGDSSCPPCSILSFVLPTGHCRWRGARRKRGRKLPLTRSQPFSCLFTHKVTPTYLRVMRCLEPRPAAPAATIAHSSRVPTPPRERHKEGLRVPRICVTSQGAGMGTLTPTLCSSSQAR